MRKFFFLLFVFLCGFQVMSSQAQSKDELESQRKQIQQEIEDLRKSQSAIQKNKKESLGQLARIRNLIKKRDAIIETINRQVQLINDDINTNNREIGRLKNELDTLKVQYARTIEYAYKNRSSYDMLNFIFSAVSFNDAIKRVAYLKAYREYRGKQVDNIYQTQLLLAQKNETLAANKTLKTQTLAEQSQQMKKLEEEKKQKDAVVSSLKLKERELDKQLTSKRKLENNIRNSIAAIIKREIMEAERAEKAKRDAAAKAAGTTAKAAAPAASTSSRAANKLENTPEVTAVSVGFENNRRKLPWPVAKGDITGPFGRHKIEGTRLFEDNIGVYIQTNIGAPVKAVYEGTVSSVHSFGPVSAVTIRHGKYLTTYYNLTGISVNKDQEIKLGQVIGKAAESEDEDGIGKVLFVVTVVVGNSPKYLNPEDWIKPR
ncbi:peptidoglycan DD-metalloendopeptidase family protein [Agriterribacter sp.]|uniref:murein hydrolase activator EnvC family protein n=1 Tax=Agriterribacter sp. TaxID=2821509 RepID=UPI002BB88054|nr:peptidoglycan DD-metalloendopeptidase family protein [Agriterribacter sp.]HRO46556.1 peptidoglycan DD-metalloendopeptidase family protein [Agriterribacter sp.]HRQ19017.1 peptidoglycan DD-metalloendopeptidase family protein [Agriterribacter sp.]